MVNLTQFERAMEELGISIIAGSAPAKGRIEKLWETFQDRLIVELRLEGIDSIEKANEFIPDFVKRFNDRFAVEPEDPTPAFRELSSNLDLDYILCFKRSRMVDNGGVFSLDGQRYQLVDEKGKIVPVTPRAKVTVLTSSRIGIRVQYGNSIYAVRKFDEPPKKVQKTKQDGSSNKPKPHKPAADHPWKQGWKKAPSYWYEESDRESLEALYNSTRAWR